VNAYSFTYDRQIARPAPGPPVVRGSAIVLPLAALDRDLRTAELLPGCRGIAGLALVNRGDGRGELRLTPPSALRGRYPFALVLRYSDGIQHVDDKLEGEVFVAAELVIRFTEHGTVRVDLPVTLAVTPALTEPGRYRLEPLDGGRPLQIRTVCREERRLNRATGRVEPIDDPMYLELFVTPQLSGRHRLHLPALAIRAGGLYGPVSGELVARLVKRGFAEKTLGPRAAHAHELAPGVVFSAIFAEDERAGGRGGSRG
jgi:hypothetical protein